MSTRIFVELGADGTVLHRNEASRASWEGVEIPSTLVEITDRPKVGPGWRRQPDGTFAPPLPPLPVPPDPRDARLQAIEDLIKRIATKVGA